ncbi:progestin and adipoQ receptor family member 3 isoform X2 [Bradysia coprophila]|uniref:progestin and adipoQ receptor family member 3 isoform X2 n=1 Tax=Bradysia coprophila TaxID=38358 RepID=UPI00187D76DE|nr:progestin and adipoQ receptor family member 3 isoform X2 [Bradysia coprophila]
MEDCDYVQNSLVSAHLTMLYADGQCVHRNAKTIPNKTNSCDIENSTVKLLNTLEVTRATFSKPEKRSKTQAEKDVENEKSRQLLSFDDAPKHLQFNPFIRNGYRTYLSTKMCVESMFWWTNETVNIWSHVFGWLLFVGLTINDINFLSTHASFIDKIMVGTLLICFQTCMIFSTIYHTFSCKSEKHYDRFLSIDLLGIALSLLAIYISGIYYAFWCHDDIRLIYIIAVGVIFVTAMVIQIPHLNVSSHLKIIIFVGWALFGILPTTHWAIKMGGFHNKMVSLLIRRVIGMYMLSGIAFLIYIAKIPERWMAGRVDFFGHSHNWWHFFVLAALYYWHDTGMTFAVYVIEHGCVEDRAKCYA